MRIFPSQSPFSEHDPVARWNERFTWPAWWVDNPAAGTPPFVCAYRLQVSFDSPQTLRFHVSADERYILYLDDQRLGRGPELGDPMNWFYESFETTIAPGAHTFWAVVWSLGERRAEAQMSVQPGFLFAVEGEQVGLSTGLADWQTCLLPGWDFIDPMPAVWRGDRFRISAPFPELDRLHTLPWQPARRTTRAMDRIVDWDLHRKRRLQPATLLSLLSRIHRPGKVRSVSAPPTSERSAVQAIPLVEGSSVGGAAASLDDWQAFADGAEITLPPDCIRRVVFDLQDYLVAYPEMIVSGGAGALIRLSWEESGRAAPDPWNTHKGHRDELAGKYLTGLADEYLPDGSAQARFAPLWWQAGRYLELLVATAGEPLTLHALALEETRYPLEMESDFQPADARLRETLPLLVRGLQTNANEIIVDTPYYEEQQYTGDVLVQSLCHYVMSGDNRLVRKAIRLYDSSRLPDGFLQSRYPSHKTQLIAPYSLWWIHMLRDYLYWRDDPDFVRALLPGMRATLEAFRRHLSTHSGLLQAPYGWNIMDWVPEWDQDAGVPPDGLAGESGLLNWQLVYALTLAADLETRAGEAAFAAHYAQWAGDLARVSFSAFWDETQGLLADDRAHTLYSEHTQVMAVLSQRLPPEAQTRIAAGLRQANLQRATYYFTHFLLEAYRLLDLDDLIHAQLKRWHADMVLKGLKTPLERVEPSRSDCHAWASHPLYHYFATLLGIRPASPGFHSVEICPRLGELAQVEGTLIHPGGGKIYVAFQQSGAGLNGSVSLPAGISGQFVYAGKTHPLAEGDTDLGGLLAG